MSLYSAIILEPSFSKSLDYALSFLLVSTVIVLVMSITCIILFIKKKNKEGVRVLIAMGIYLIVGFGVCATLIL